MTEEARFPVGIWVVVGFHLLNVLLWSVGQTGALLDYDFVAELGLQDARALVDPVIVQVNKGIAVADTVLMLPLFLLAVVGLVRRRFFGLVTSWLVLGITLYWPLVFWFSQYSYSEAGIRHVPLSGSTVIVPAVFFVMAAWAAWYLARHRGLFQ